MNTAEPIYTWRTTRAGTYVLARDGDDMAHAWPTKAGRYAAHVWAEPAPVYRDTMAEALQYITERTGAEVPA